MWLGLLADTAIFVTWLVRNQGYLGSTHAVFVATTVTAIGFQVVFLIFLARNVQTREIKRPRARRLFRLKTAYRCCGAGILSLMKVLLINEPYVKGFNRTQRWAARTRGRVLRAPDWLAYATAVLERDGIEAKLFDFPPWTGPSAT